MYRFIVNGSAGGGRAAKVRPTIEGYMARVGSSYTLHETGTSEEAGGLARRGAVAGDVVVAVGGDGSIHHVTEGFVSAGDRTGPGAALGILPTGTGNDLARMLNLPEGIEEVLELLQRAPLRRIDYGMATWKGPHDAGARAFLNVAGIGLDAKSAKLAVKLKPYIGNLCYTVAPALSVWNWKAPHTEVLVHDATDTPFQWKGRLLLASVANGKWVGGGITISPAAELDDGLLDLCLVGAMNPFRALRILPKAVKGTHEVFPEVSAHQFERLTLALDHPIPIHLDGEPCTDGATWAEFEIAAGQISVVAPPPS